ncbi:MAG: carbohydrate ABC transporter permease [Treponema sp.]|jgi:putative aldouronate transport system permease protein|nr:carbohydrate ABC transporter permease [Treponema sp.]
MVSRLKKKRGGALAARCFEDKVYDAVIFWVLSLLLVSVAYPLYYVLISSISDPVRVNDGDVLFYPLGVTLDGYLKVLENGNIVRGFFNSVYYSVLAVVLTLAFTLPLGYALSRNDFVGRKPISIFYVITMFVGGGMIPTYLVVRATGLLNTGWALTLPGAVGVWGIMVCRTFFKTNIPGELLDAAKIDGCSNTVFFFRCVLPLSSAIIALQVLWTGVGQWNSYFSALLYLSDREKMPLQMELRQILVLNSNPQAAAAMTEEAIKEKERLEALKQLMKYSLIVLSNIPVIIIYPFIQKHFVKGVVVGSLKG